MPKLESVLDNEMCKILQVFEVQTDHPIWARQPDIVIMSKKKKKKKEGHPSSQTMKWKFFKKAKKEISSYALLEN